MQLISCGGLHSFGKYSGPADAASGTLSQLCEICICALQLWLHPYGPGPGNAGTGRTSVRAAEPVQQGFWGFAARDLKAPLQAISQAYARLKEDAEDKLEEEACEHIALMLQTSRAPRGVERARQQKAAGCIIGHSAGHDILNRPNHLGGDWITVRCPRPGAP
ncbi:hypothetical protein [Leisingera sp. JC11]|uniref:hypothetical protein n=1 Tax=Leisingera sp. JC11 TaxID=3042469 RepID=UPI00345735D9